MPLDPLDPNVFSLTPEQRTADKFAVLDRRVGAGERSSLNEVLRRRQYSEALPEVSTSSTTAVDLGGPSVTLNVPTNAFVAIYAEVDLFATTIDGASVVLYEPTDLPTTSNSLMFTNQGTYATFRSTPGAAGTTRFGGSVIVRATPGLRTYALRYFAGAGNTGFFRNRRLWAEAV